MTAHETPHGSPRAAGSNDRYCVVIPAYNAGKTIGELVRSIKDQGLPVVVVDDGSTDNTAAVAAQHRALVISHLRNHGKGQALRTGFEHALRAKYEAVVTMDSDGQHHPEDIPKFIQAAERQHAGIVVGNRMGSAAMPPVRRCTNRLMSHIVSRLSRQEIPDSQCGFRLIHREVLATVPLRSRHYEIETELLLAASRRQWKTISVPIQTTYNGQVSYIRPLQDTVRFFMFLVRFLLQPRA